MLFQKIENNFYKTSIFILIFFVALKNTKTLKLIQLIANLSIIRRYKKAFRFTNRSTITISNKRFKLLFSKSKNQNIHFFFQTQNLFEVNYL